MENNEIILYEVEKPIVRPFRNNYIVSLGGKEVILKRDIDFGKVPKAKTPSLWKSGAEKILLEFGLYYDTVLNDSHKDFEKGVFYYEFIARAYDKNGRIVRTGVGCCTTQESSFGMANGYNSANSAMKKAKKRAVVDLALTLGSLSDMFTQDLDDDNNEIRAKEILRDDDPITPKQAKRLFAIASNNEITAEKAKELLLGWGFSSTKEIKQKDYDSLCDAFENYNMPKAEK